MALIHRANTTPSTHWPNSRLGGLDAMTVPYNLDVVTKRCANIVNVGWTMTPRTST